MPTASEYTAMARRMDDRASELDGMPMRFVAGLSSEIGSGPYIEAIDGTFQVSAQHLVRAAIALRDVASVCRSRATACRAYSRALERYWAELASPDPIPISPPARQPWMEYGP